MLARFYKESFFNLYLESDIGLGGSLYAGATLGSKSPEIEKEGRKQQDGPTTIHTNRFEPRGASDRSWFLENGDRVFRVGFGEAA